jgi:preprotein translocase subunit SecD
MSLTRKSLKEIGLTEEQITEVIEGHSETVNALKEDLAKYKAEADKVPDLQRQVEASKEKNADTYKDKYDKLKQEFTDYKAQQTKEKTTAQKREAYRKLLEEAGVSEKRIAAVLKVSDIESIELDADGKVKDQKGVVDSIKTEWADFIQSGGKAGAKTPMPPQSSGKAMTKEEIMGIKNSADRQRAIAENHELFGF